MGDEDLVALADAAKEIERSREWLRRRALAGEVRYSRVGRVIGIPRAEVRRLKRELAGKPKPRGHWPKGKARKGVSYDQPQPELRRCADAPATYDTEPPAERPAPGEA
jgi:hypothetical protein